MQQSAFIALRWMRQGLGLLTAYALISAAALAMLGATTAGSLLFSVAAAVTVLAGGGLLAGDPRVLYDISHPAPSAGVLTPSGGVLIPAGAGPRPRHRRRQARRLV